MRGVLDQISVRYGPGSTRMMSIPNGSSSKAIESATLECPFRRAIYRVCGLSHESSFARDDDNPARSLRSKGRQDRVARAHQKSSSP